MNGQRQDPPEPGGAPRAAGAGPLSRRGLLSGGSAAAVATVLGMRAISRVSAAPPDVESRMILQVAQAGSLFPLRMPAHGALSPRARIALGRFVAAQRHSRSGWPRLDESVPPSFSQLRRAEQAMPMADLAAGHAGARLLIGAGLLDSGHAEVLAGLGQLTASAAPADQSALQAAAALAVGTVFPAAPHGWSAGAARQWLAMLSAMHQRGTLRTAVRSRRMR